MRWCQVPKGSGAVNNSHHLWFEYNVLNLSRNPQTPCPLGSYGVQTSAPQHGNPFRMARWLMQILQRPPPPPNQNLVQ